LNTLLPTVEHSAIELIKEMLIYDPQKRISAKAALIHSYFS